MQAFFDRIIKPYITPQVEEAVAKSGIKEGLCLVNASHITASVFMNDAEETISLIESHEHSGRPLEDKKFIERVEALTGRKLHKLKPGPKNESFEKIYNHCKGKRNVRVIKVKRNLGFARGCNVGIDYALKQKCEHVLVINGDTIFIDKDMIVKLLKVAEDQKIGLIGPGILGADPKDQKTMFKENPCNTETTFRRMFSDLKYEIFGPRFIYTLLMGPWLKKFLKRFIKINRNKLIECDDGGHTESLETIISNNLVLNGSAILFTKNYFKHFTCGFYPGTFLYYEENILNVIARKEGIWMACVPQANIYHKGAGSSLLSYGNNLRVKSKHRARSILTCLYVKIMSLILLGIERRPDLSPDLIVT